MTKIGDSQQRALIKHVFFKQKVKHAIIKFQRMLRIWPRDFLLITGAPRSGTSALRSWLSPHREVIAFNESRILVSIHRFIEEVYRFNDLEKYKKVLMDMARRFIYEYYANLEILLGRTILIDKEPLEPIAFPDTEYKKFLKNVRMLIPEAKFLFMIRDPIDTVWSMTQKKWGVSLTDPKLYTFSIEEHIENWCSCADLILQYATDSNTYICQFGRLVKDSMSESSKIFDFLKIKECKPFKPCPTQEIGLNNKERELILRMTHPQLEALHAHGILDFY